MGRQRIRWAPKLARIFLIGCSTLTEASSNETQTSNHYPIEAWSRPTSTASHPGRHTMVIAPPVDFSAWVEAVAPTLAPPVANRLLYGSESALKVMLVGGPNERSDFHLQEGEELFVQLCGDMELDLVEHDRFRTVRVPEGHAFVLPSRIPHSPQRPAGSIGLVFERGHFAHERDSLMWFERELGNRQDYGDGDAIDYVSSMRPESGDPVTPVEYQEFFHCTDLGSQLKPIIDRYHAFTAARRERGGGTKPLLAPEWEGSHPPVTADNQAEADRPVDLRWLLRHEAPAPASAFRELLSGREASMSLLARKSLHLSSLAGDLLLWQLHGESVVRAGNSDATIILKSGFTMLVPSHASLSIDPVSGSTAHSVLLLTNRLAVGARREEEATNGPTLAAASSPLAVDKESTQDRRIRKRRELEKRPQHFHLAL